MYISTATRSMESARAVSVCNGALMVMAHILALLSGRPALTGSRRNRAAVGTFPQMVSPTSSAMSPFLRRRFCLIKYSAALRQSAMCLVEKPFSQPFSQPNLIGWAPTDGSKSSYPEYLLWETNGLSGGTNALVHPFVPAP